MADSVRIDKWLWAARFFKTRGKAREAIVGGKVHLNGNRVKPGRVLATGDRLQITRGLEEFVVTVRTLEDRRGPASAAQAMYSEDDSSREKREAVAEQRSLLRKERAERTRRPDKRQRRQLIRFRQDTD